MYSIDQNIRNEVFYLLKKYTSYRYLYAIYGLEKEFVNAFEQQLRHPPLAVQKQSEGVQEYHEREFLSFLEDLSYREKGLKALQRDFFKKVAYEQFFQANFFQTIFGRYGDEHGLVADIFYQNLGLGQEYPNLFSHHDHSKYILKLLISGETTSIAIQTLYDVTYSFPNDSKKYYEKWNYETLFSYKNWPLCKQIVEPVIPCPSYNNDSKGEIKSGEEIQISGIYEPWFDQPMYEKLTQDLTYNFYVGCPNYFLEGSIATQYKLEGTDQDYDVKWRLIWQDQRYLDGNISEEEQHYVLDVEIELQETESDQLEEVSVKGYHLSSGDKVPKTGYWFTVAQENSRQYFKKGSTFPNLKTDWGKVYWQYDGE